MSELVDRIVANIVRLEVRLLACQARLEADTDPEALTTCAPLCAACAACCGLCAGCRGLCNLKCLHPRLAC